MTDGVRPHADRLRRDARRVERVREAQAASDRVLRDACERAGHAWIGSGALQVSLGELADLLDRFARWNERAGAAQGYRVD